MYLYVLNKYAAAKLSDGTIRLGQVCRGPLWPQRISWGPICQLARAQFAWDRVIKTYTETGTRQTSKRSRVLWIFIVQRAALLQRVGRPARKHPSGRNYS